MKRTLIIPTLLGLLWTLLLAALFLWSVKGERRHIAELAENQAKAMFQQIVATRSWNSANGGVFVPFGENTVPNPYLPEDERLLRLDDTQALVKVNPAFMTRQISEIAAVQNDVRFHITSLVPVRPENAPDSWERESLALLTPASSRFELVPSPDGAGKFRYMAPLLCEVSCVRCHPSDLVGSVRGAITVSIPAEPLLGYQEANLKKQTVAYGIIWIIGLLGLVGTSFELNRRKELAEASNLTKSRFLANMSHDMRTPLTGILGLTERLLAADGLDERGMRNARLISHSARNLLEVVNDILDFSRLDSDRLELENDAFDPRVAVDKVALVFSYAAQEKNLTFSSHVDSSVPAALAGDEFRYRQVLANLLGNAVKFTDKGFVSVLVSAKPDGDGWIMLSTTVRDSGVGITPEDREAIFGCFNQVDDSLSRRHAGSGLGLSIARQLARLMGGDVTLESQAGKGSTFTFTVRLRQAEASTLASKPDRPQQAPPAVCDRLCNRTVLVVDDHRANRVLLADILEEQGAIPVMAKGGREALELAGAQRFDLVLMDLQMPGMGGVETLERLHALNTENGRPRVPAVILTAFAQPEDAAELPQGLAEAIVTKPLDVPHLLRVLTAVLGDAPEAPPAPQLAPVQTAAPDGAEADILEIDPALKLLNGRKDFYAMLAQEFFACSEELRAGFERAVAQGDHREAARIAHILKTSAGALGARKLGGMAAELERLARQQASLSDDHRRSLDGLMAQTLRALRAVVPLQ